ncbi:MAG: GNAT family N-acetyltransferase [Pseudomonadota bacterium]
MTAPKLTIRPARADDHSVVAPLMMATEEHYYGAPSGDWQFAHSWTQDGVADDSDAADSTLHLAFLDDRAVAYASVALVSPSNGPRGRTLFMKELFVAESARGAGTGEAMMAYLARLAVEKGCARLDFTTTDINAGARRFYARLGAREASEKLYLRLEGDALAALASANVNS